MSSTIPTMARGPAANDGIKAWLIPFARSEGLGVDEEVAIASNDRIMPRTVATRQRAANASATAPAHSIQRVARVCGMAVDAVVDSYGFAVMKLNADADQRLVRPSPPVP